MDINSAGGRDKGIDFDKLFAVNEYQSSDLFTAAEKAALRYTEEMCKESVNVPDEVFEDVRRHYNDDAIVELTSIIALENSRARFNRALLIPGDGLCQLPANHPVLRASNSESAAAGN